MEMNKKTSCLIMALLSLLFTLLMTGEVAAATPSVTTTSTSNDTLYYDSTDGKMYTDDALTKVYTEQTGKWSSFFMSGMNTYVLQLNNFNFTTTQNIGLKLVHSGYIELAAGSNNHIVSTFSGNSFSAGIYGMGTVIIYSTGDGSGTLYATAGSSTNSTNYSMGLGVADSFRFISGHLFTNGGGDDDSVGLEADNLNFYSGEITATGEDCGLYLRGSGSGTFVYENKTAVFIGDNATAATQKNIPSDPGNLSLLMAGSYFRMLSCCSDVPYNAWYGGYIYPLLAEGYIVGYASSDGVTFKVLPENKITRAEFVTVLARVFASENTLNSYMNQYSFTDVPGWASKYVGWAAVSGYVQGYDAAHFGADDNITRQDIVTILYRIVSKQSLHSNMPRPAVVFTDAAEVSPYAKTAVSAMQQDGIIGGIGNGDGSYHFNPLGQAKRSETFTMIYNFIHAYNL